MNTIALWIFASIFAGVGVVLSQTNHLHLSISFGVISVVILLISLFIHREESKDQTKPSNKDKLGEVFNSTKKVIQQASCDLTLVQINEFKAVYDNNKFYLGPKLRKSLDMLLSDLQDLRIDRAERIAVGTGSEKNELVARERNLLNKIESHKDSLEKQFKDLFK